MVKYDVTEKKPDTHFSVTYSCTIGGAQFRPSICYELTNNLASTVREMVVKKLARTYTERQRFISGIPRPAVKTTLPPPVMHVSHKDSGPVVVGTDNDQED